jgi:hypothetical protein
MRVRVDEARQQRDVAEVDHFRAGRNGTADRLDARSFDDDDRAVHDLVRRAVEEARGLQCHEARR